MKFLCLTPLYNHHQRLTQNVYQALVDQTHGDWVWVLGDDRPWESQLPGLLEPDPRVVIKRFHTRCESMGEKYTAMVAHAEEQGIQWDAIAIMDGDDMFMPKHLEKHAEALSWSLYSRPSVVLTAITGIVQVESSTGRFWSSVAFTRKGLERVGGFGDSKFVGFDQEMLTKFKKLCGETDHETPTYVYRWADTASDHASGHSSGFACTEWWGKVPVMPGEGLLYPRYDDATDIFIIPGAEAVYAKRKESGLSY